VSPRLRVIPEASNSAFQKQKVDRAIKREKRGRKMLGRDEGQPPGIASRRMTSSNRYLIRGGGRRGGNQEIVYTVGLGK